MKTVVSVKIEKELWESAKDLSEELGIPLSTVIGANLREFVRTRKLVLASEPQLKPEIRRLLDDARDERANDPDVSPKFDNVKAAMDWLKE